MNTLAAEVRRVLKTSDGLCTYWTGKELDNLHPILKWMTLDFVKCGFCTCCGTWGLLKTLKANGHEDNIVTIKSIINKRQVQEGEFSSFFDFMSTYQFYDSATDTFRIPAWADKKKCTKKGSMNKY